MCVAPPPLRPDASQPTMPLSSTRTSTPARASHHPALRPVTPPPTITTSAPLLLFMACTTIARPAGECATAAPHGKRAMATLPTESGLQVPQRPRQVVRGVLEQEGDAVAPAEG